MFANHGSDPEWVAGLSRRSKAMMLAMAVKEIRSRPKK
jgi:hypothetical protein